MTSPRQQLAEADLAAATARGRFMATLGEAKQQLSPDHIIGLLGETVRKQSETVADRMIAKLTSRPVLMTLAFSLIGTLLRRGPVVRTIWNLFFGRSATRRGSRHSAIGKDKETAS